MYLDNSCVAPPAACANCRKLVPHAQRIWKQANALWRPVALIDWVNRAPGWAAQLLPWQTWACQVERISDPRPTCQMHVHPSSYRITHHAEVEPNLAHPAPVQGVATVKGLGAAGAAHQQRTGSASPHTPHSSHWKGPLQPTPPPSHRLGLSVRLYNWPTLTTGSLRTRRWGTGSP